LAISLFTSFGFFERAEENQRVLENVHASLAPGGTCVIDVLGKEPLARKFVAADASELDDGAILFSYRKVLEGWSHLESQWILVKGSSAERFGFRIWIYSGSELKRMLEHAGFAGVRLFGSLAGSPYDLNATRLVAVAKKAS
jgi:hypothetical protein